MNNKSEILDIVLTYPFRGTAVLFNLSVIRLSFPFVTLVPIAIISHSIARFFSTRFLILNLKTIFKGKLTVHSKVYGLWYYVTTSICRCIGGKIINVYI